MSLEDKNLNVIFDITDMDLAFTYVDRQKKVLEEQGQPMLPYKILIGATEVVVQLDLTNADPDNPLGLNGNGEEPN